MRNRLHHRVPDAGIIQRVTGALDDANLRIRPDRCERMRGRWRAQKIIAALHDDARDRLQLFGVRHELIRFHEAIIVEIMRLHERRGGQGTR